MARRVISRNVGRSGSTVGNRMTFHVYSTTIATTGHIEEFDSDDFRYTDEHGVERYFVPRVIDNVHVLQAPTTDSDRGDFTITSRTGGAADNIHFKGLREFNFSQRGGMPLLHDVGYAGNTSLSVRSLTPGIFNIVVEFRS